MATLPARCDFDGMTIWKTTLALILPAALVGSVAAQDMSPPPWGVQAGFTMPMGSDLRTTVGSGLNPTLGVSRDWSWVEGQTLRGRLDLSWFAQGRQTSDTPVLHQEIRTRVKAAALGADYLVHAPCMGGRWSFGVGLGLIRWTVTSSNRLEQSNGLFLPAGSSSWTRTAESLVGTYRWNARLESELRIVSSHYGYENLPTRTASVNVLWHF